MSATLAFYVLACAQQICHVRSYDFVKSVGVEFRTASQIFVADDTTGDVTGVRVVGAYNQTSPELYVVDRCLFVGFAAAEAVVDKLWQLHPRGSVVACGNESLLPTQTTESLFVVEFTKSEESKAAVAGVVIAVMLIAVLICVCVEWVGTPTQPMPIYWTALQRRETVSAPSQLLSLPSSAAVVAAARRPNRLSQMAMQLYTPVLLATSIATRAVVVNKDQ
jgi:hypothetical protein